MKKSLGVPSSLGGEGRTGGKNPRLSRKSENLARLKHNEFLVLIFLPLEKAKNQEYLVFCPRLALCSQASLVPCLNLSSLVSLWDPLLCIHLWHH